MRVLTRSAHTGDWVERAARANSITITDELNERSTARFTLIDPTGTTHHRRGDNVLIEHGVETVFRGFIERATESRLGLEGSREHQIECADLHYLADKRIVADAFTNVTAGSIVNSLITDYLSAEGITAGAITPGPVIRAITFNYIPVSDAIQELATRAGFWWRVDVEGRLDFREPAAFLAALAGSESIQAGDDSVLAGGESASDDAVAISLDTDALADTVSVTRYSPAYRNRQWVKGGRDRTITQVETQYGDGEATAFVLGYDLAEAPTIEVSRAGAAFATETVGEAGLQVDSQWVYSLGKNSVQQKSTETVLAAADRVRVTYTGSFDVIARVDNADLQAERAATEGGSGIVERVLTDKTSDSGNAAFQLASELIEYYGRAAIIVRFVTRTIDYYPGKAVSVTFDEAALDAESGLVTTVEWFSRFDQAHAVVTIVIGPMEGSWAQWFGALSRRIDKLADPRGGEAEVITTLEEFVKTWSAVEVPNIFYQAFPGASTFPGATLLAAFEPADRVRVMAWSFGGVEVGRKFITAQDAIDPNEIITTTLLTTVDAVGGIDELVWIGGAQATGTAGTGVEVDRQAYVKTKTDIEQVQVEKTDLKWA